LGKQKGSHADSLFTFTYYNTKLRLRKDCLIRKTKFGENDETQARDALRGNESFFDKSSYGLMRTSLLS